MNELAGREYAGPSRHHPRRAADSARSLFLAGVAAWALRPGRGAGLAANPIAAIVPLSDAGRHLRGRSASLHLGVERIGRYVQVFFEEAAADAVLLTAACLGAHRDGVRPERRRAPAGIRCFLPMFLIATLSICWPCCFPGPVAVELAHARGAARRVCRVDALLRSRDAEAAATSSHGFAVDE